MNRQPEAQPRPLTCVHGPGPDQLQLVSQLHSYWIANQNLALQVGAIRTQAESLKQENARLHQSYVIECQQHERTVKELLDLRELVHRLDEMFPSGNEDELPSVVPAFFELEARYAALRQAEAEICKKAKDLRMSCENIEQRYVHGLREPTSIPNPGELIRQPRYLPQYPSQIGAGN